MRKNLKKILLIFTAVFCFSIAASAQKSSNKKGERKPPVIVPDEDRKQKDNKPKDKDKKPKPRLMFKYMQAKVESLS